MQEVKPCLSAASRHGSETRLVDRHGLRPLFAQRPSRRPVAGWIVGAIGQFEGGGIVSRGAGGGQHLHGRLSGVTPSDPYQRQLHGDGEDPGNVLHRQLAVVTGRGVQQCERLGHALVKARPKPCSPLLATGHRFLQAALLRTFFTRTRLAPEAIVARISRPGPIARVAGTRMPGAASLRAKLLRCRAQPAWTHSDVSASALTTRALRDTETPVVGSYALRPTTHRGRRARRARHPDASRAGAARSRGKRCRPAPPPRRSGRRARPARQALARKCVLNATMSVMCGGLHPPDARSTPTHLEPPAIGKCLTGVNCGRYRTA